MIKLENYIKYKTYIYNILSASSLILLGIIALSLVDPETSTTYAAENSAENAEGDSGVALLANTTTPSATLEISNSGDNTVLANPDSGTVYSTHSITMSSVNISNYTLSISAPAELQSVSGKTTLSGANGTTGNSMTNNTWGYSYDKAGNISDTGSLAYSSFTGSTQNLESGTAPTTSSRNLILAAKFGDNAEAGHYTGTVNLLLTATPKTLTTFSVSYNCNSGSSCPSNYSESSYDDSITYTIPSTAPTRSGYNFLGYNTTNSSTADSTYAPGKTITLTKSSNTRTLYAVWQLKSTTYTLTLNANGGSGGPGSQTCTATGTATSCTITISSTKPTRTGYDFQGWGTISTTSTVSYNPGSSITMTGSKTIYAVWKQQPQGLKSLTNMQDMTSAACTASAIGDTATLKDTRDNNTYTVAKLADGKCWMTQNLRIVNKTISPSDSNVSSSYTIPASATWTDTSNTGNHAYYNNDTDYGAYYTWYTATAGTSASTYDICPKGWRLPTGGSSGEFQILYTKYPNTNSPSLSTLGGKNGYWLGASSASTGGSFFLFPGYMNTDDGALFNVGYFGYYWSSTPISASAYYLHLGGTLIRPVSTNLRYFGESVRCVAK